MKTINAVAAIVTISVSVAGFTAYSASASVITTGCADTNSSCTMQELLNGGSIQVFDKVFDNWRLGNFQGDPVPLPESIVVAPLADNVMNPGLQYTTSLQANDLNSPDGLADTVSASWAYDVSVSDGSIMRIHDYEIALIDYSLMRDPNFDTSLSTLSYVQDFVDLYEDPDFIFAIVNPLPTAAIHSAPPENDLVNVGSSSQHFLIEPRTSLSVAHTVIVWADQGTASLGMFEERFSQISQIPEPATLALFCLSLLGMMFLRWRKKKLLSGIVFGNLRLQKRSCTTKIAVVNISVLITFLAPLILSHSSSAITITTYCSNRQHGVYGLDEVSKKTNSTFSACLVSGETRSGRWPFEYEARAEARAADGKIKLYTSMSQQTAGAGAARANAGIKATGVISDPWVGDLPISTGIDGDWLSIFSSGIGNTHFRISLKILGKEVRPGARGPQIVDGIMDIFYDEEDLWRIGTQSNIGDFKYTLVGHSFGAQVSVRLEGLLPDFYVGKELEYEWGLEWFQFHPGFMDAGGTANIGILLPEDYSFVPNEQEFLADAAPLTRDPLTFSSQTIPEPTSLFLFGFGLIGITAIRRIWSLHAWEAAS